MLPELLEIPKLDAFDSVTFAVKIEDIVSRPSGNPISNRKSLRDAIVEVDDNALEKDGITADAQLNGGEKAVTTGNANLLMVPGDVNARVTQEVPSLRVGRDRVEKRES
jgi:hypothetical protein